AVIAGTPARSATLRTVQRPRSRCSATVASSTRVAVESRSVMPHLPATHGRGPSSRHLPGSAQVLRTCHRLEMGRVHARPHAAEMIQVKALGDRTHDALVGEPMGSYRPTVRPPECP